MTEYEAATLAIRSANLWAVYGQTAVSIVIGVGQIIVIALGIRAMKHATDRRADDTRQLATEGERRHAEAMQAFDLQRQALETLIARTGRTGADA